MNKKITSMLTILALSVSTVNMMPLIALAQNPSPYVYSINPSTKTAGEPSFTLTVNGSNFIPGSVVRLDGSPRSTTYVSLNRVTAVVTSADISASGSHGITVVNPTPQGGTSNQVMLTVNPATPFPVITSISPAQVAEDGQNFTLTVHGFNFVASNMPSVVRINGQDRTTTVVSSNQLNATILAGDIASVGIKSITVHNEGPNNQGTSNAVNLTVLSTMGGLPVITSISPMSKIAGSSGFALTVFGFNFDVDTVVRFNGVAKPTTFVSANQLTASIPSSDVATVGSYVVSVSNPGVGNSNSLMFNVSALPGLPNTGIGPEEEGLMNWKALLAAGLVSLFAAYLFFSVRKVRAMGNKI